MVDEVELAVPVEVIGVAGGAVDVEGEGVEPDGEGCDVGIGLSPAAGSNMAEPGR
jgi:hypothetical protein